MDRLYVWEHHEQGQELCSYTFVSTTDVSSRGNAQLAEGLGLQRLCFCQFTLSYHLSQCDTTKYLHISRFIIKVFMYTFLMVSFALSGRLLISKCARSWLWLAASQRLVAVAHGQVQPVGVAGHGDRHINMH